MSHIRFHLYLFAVCASNGYRPTDWGEARLVLRALIAMGRATGADSVFGMRQSNTGAVSEWMGAMRGGCYGG